ncbi:hypothetical protein L484_005597 [Morus notabilis]|uniref:Uncharacterized protein n=1 Tax=Morus notabilis TaxID=981085 RepID=W9RQE3_9ROSA|nr:hypothetical protein L484_005597 [Morus notabilis]
MEDSSSRISLSPEKAPSEILEELRKQHEEKTSRIQELKRQIESAKLSLEKRKNKIPAEKMEAFKSLSEKYIVTREEHNSLLAHDEEFGK